MRLRRKCRVCERRLSPNSYFLDGRGGLRSECKDCHKTSKKKPREQVKVEVKMHPVHEISYQMGKLAAYKEIKPDYDYIHRNLMIFFWSSVVLLIYSLIATYYLWK